MKSFKAVTGTALAGIALLSGCTTTPRGATRDAALAGNQVASATIRNAAGVTLGAASVMQSAAGLDVTIAGEGMVPGMHGLHVHMVGRCDAPAFTTAGDHWNPDSKQHGRDNPMGAHRGDLPNLVVGADGRGSVSFVIPGTNAAEMLDADGSAIVIHAAADDYRTDPSGKSGARIACGVFNGS